MLVDLRGMYEASKNLGPKYSILVGFLQYVHYPISNKNLMSKIRPIQYYRTEEVYITKSVI